MNCLRFFLTAFFLGLLGYEVNRSRWGSERARPTREGGQAPVDPSVAPPTASSADRGGSERGSQLAPVQPRAALGLRACGGATGGRIVTLVGFKGQNHPQQVGRSGARDEVDDRGTDPDFFAVLDARFGFTLDVAAAPHNAKCERYFTIHDDGLAQSWAGERVWCNPPYSGIDRWVAKAHDSDAELVVMLLPANRTEQRWWQDHVEPHRDRPDSKLRVEFLRGRLRFVKPGERSIGPNERPPFGCCLLIWAPSPYGETR